MRLSRGDAKKIQELRSFFPNEIEVKVRRSIDGGFCAEVLTFPRVITEADTLTELIEMVNDAVLNYFEIPEKYSSFVPNYLPPLRVAQEFGVFPVVEKEKRLKMRLAVPA